jgi:hypothetical protein
VVDVAVLAVREIEVVEGRVDQPIVLDGLEELLPPRL